MKLTIFPEKLVTGLQRVIGVVERRMTLPILANVLCTIQGNNLLFTATDLEVEIEYFILLENTYDMIQFTVPGYKFFDICKSLNSGPIELSYDNQKITLATSSARYILATLPAADFPNIEEDKPILEFTLPQLQLKQLLERTQYAMADQDIRYYLNGMLWQVANAKLHIVAMDGHRFAYTNCVLDKESPTHNILVPFKGIKELSRLLAKTEAPVVVKFCSNYLWVDLENTRFRCKLIDGNFPDYQRILHHVGQKQLSVEKQPFKQALSRLAILANTHINAVRVEINSHLMRLFAINQTHDEAWEELSVRYEGESVVLGFNIQYLLDALTVIESDTVIMHFENLDKGVLLEGSQNENASFVIMPLRL